MGYFKKISSLEEKASAQVAINLCQETGFKEVVLSLEKPTYGTFIPKYVGSFFLSDPEKLLLWAKINEDDEAFEDFRRSCSMTDKEKVRQWDAAIDEQCQRLTKELPYFLKHGVHAWINRIALEYLSYIRRQEVLFGVSRYFLMNILTRGDWMESGRLNEKKLAERLLQDEWLTNLQKYRIACVYCLHENIPQLWKRLTHEEKQSISGNDNPYLSQESHHLVLLWSYHMDGDREERVTRRKNHQWTYAVEKAIYYGNQAALMQCWKRLKEPAQQQIVIDMALQSVKTWQSIQNEFYVYDNWKEKLVSNDLPSTQYHIYYVYFNLPSYYTELMYFFLLQMDEEQQLTFFKKAFKNRYCDSVLECFLDWPHQDYFLPTINRLWGIIPKDKYGQCLLTLASKYSGVDEKESRYYNYRNLLWTLWEETPKDYKRHVFLDKKLNGIEYPMINEGKVLLPQLLARTPFQEKDEALFKQVFYDQPPEERTTMMCSEVGENICLILAQKEKWPFMNWLLEQCLPKEEISSFKKQFIQSDCSCKFCLYKLEENDEKLLDDLINWSLELDTEKKQFKYELVSGDNCLALCVRLLRKEKFTVVEHMINFCLSSDEMREQFKVHFAKYTCSDLLMDCAWEQMDKILAWSVNAQEKISDLKKDLFCNNGVDTHYTLVFIHRQWEEVENFYKWFNLSTEEITKLKKDTIFIPKVIQVINEHLCGYTNILVAPLLWCLTDEKMIISLKKEIKEQCLEQVLNKQEKKECLDYLVSRLFHGFRKEIQDKASKEDNLKKRYRKKRIFCSDGI